MARADAVYSTVYSDRLRRRLLRISNRVGRYDGLLENKNDLGRFFQGDIKIQGMGVTVII